MCSLHSPSILRWELSLRLRNVPFRSQAQSRKCTPPLSPIRSWESSLCLRNVPFRSQAQTRKRAPPLFSIHGREPFLCLCQVTFHLQAQTGKCIPPLLSICNWEPPRCLLRVTFRLISGGDKATSWSFTKIGNRRIALERPSSIWSIWPGEWTRTPCLDTNQSGPTWPTQVRGDRHRMWLKQLQR